MQNTVNNAPAIHLPCNRNFWLVLLLSLITFGIYPLIVYSQISNEINTVASKYDGRKTMHYCLMTFIVSPITFGIGGLVWNHNICDRIGNELRRRGIAYNFGAADFWLWGILGSFIIVGPIVYAIKFFNAVNLMNANYNING